MIWWALATGVFAGISIAVTYAWWLAYQEIDTWRDAYERLIDRVQSPDIQTYRAFNPPETSDNAGSPQFRIFTDPSGRVRHYEPMNES